MNKKSYLVLATLQLMGFASVSLAKNPADSCTIAESNPQKLMGQAIRDDNVACVEKAVSSGFKLEGQLGIPMDEHRTLIESSALHYAAKLGKNESVKALLKLGMSVNYMPKVEAVGQVDTPLNSASRAGQLSTIKLLLNSGADPNLRVVNDNGCRQESYSPLHWVACSSKEDQNYKNRVEIAKILLEHGANPNISARISAWTPLLCASFTGNLEVAKLLVDAGVDVNAPYEEVCNGADSKHYAITLAASGDDQSPAEMLEMVKFLVEKGADVNSKDESGETPLHNAAWRGSFPTVQYLISQKAFLNEVAKSGRGGFEDKFVTPLDYSLGRGHTATSEAIRNAGGKKYEELPQ